VLFDLFIHQDVKNIIRSVAGKRWENLYRQNPKAIAVYIQRINAQLKEQDTLIVWQSQIIDRLRAELEDRNEQ
jgi:hypothetical protein